MMHDLLIDLGNSAIKWSLSGRYDQCSNSSFNLDLLPEADQIWVSCVGDRSLLKGLDRAKFVTSQAQFGQFISAYSAPETLGVDRFLAMVGALDQCPDQDLLVIDAGSALTFDVVLASGEHQGGLIMPGLGMLQRSFAKFAQNDKTFLLKPLTNNTLEAWASGTSCMLIDTLTKRVEQYLEQYPNLQILLTGGDAKLLALHLQHKATVEPHLVLQGLQIYAQTQAD